jgi:hypothetical protein
MSVLVAAFCAIVVGCTPPTVPAGYAVDVSLPLAPGPDRMSGRLEVLEDERIRPEMRTAIADAFGDDPCVDRPPAVLESLCRARGQPLRPALLRLKNAHGDIVATRTAARPLAALAMLRLYGTERRTYLFTVDLSAGLGSYSGPFTRLAEPDSSGFGWLVADSAAVATDTITLISTLKTAWRTWPRRDGRGQDLLMVLCRPDFSAPDSEPSRFLLTFERYTFDGHRWVLRQRQRDGCYESDEPFPAATNFP